MRSTADPVVVESFCQGKTSDDRNEDCIVIDRNFIAVVDGVTSKSNFSYGGKTTGKLAGELVAQTIRSAPPDIDLHGLTDAVNRRFRDFYSRVDFPYDIHQLGLQAMASIYSHHRHEVWMVGDCQVNVDGNIWLNTKQSDTILADMRSLALTILVREHGGERFIAEHDEGRETILPWILRANIFANDDSTRFGYSVFNGEPIPDTLVRRIPLDDSSHEIIITSDGYPEPSSTLAEAERQLAILLRDDPYCYRRFPSTKGIRHGQHSFDDRSYIRLRI